MNFMTAVKTCLGKLTTIEGRASRSEFWWYILVLLLVFLIPMFYIPIFTGVWSMTQGWGVETGMTIGQVLVNLVFGLLTLSVSVRRFHDLDRSGWWVLLSFIPIVFLTVMIWFMFRGTQGENRFGPDPLPDAINGDLSAIGE